MTIMTRTSGGERCLLMGNETIARVGFAAVIARFLAADKQAVNLSVFDTGVALIRRKEHR